MVNIENYDQISELLQQKSLNILKEKENKQIFSNMKEADDLIRDINNNSIAFFIGCLMDRQIKAERAWTIPYKIKMIVGTLDFQKLQGITIEQWITIFNKNKLHRMNNEMAVNLYNAIQLINNNYKGNPQNIWNDNESADVVVKRFLEFNGIGQKISTMAVNILMRDFKIKFKDLKGIDISTDIQVMKVFYRLGLIKDINDKEEAISVARKLNPDYPGILDLSTWEVGRYYCDNTNPKCSDCFLNKYCKYNNRENKMEKNNDLSLKNTYYYDYNGGKGILKKVNNKWILSKGTIFAVNFEKSFINKHGNKGYSRNLIMLRNKIVELYCRDNILLEDYPVSSPSVAGAMVGLSTTNVKRKWVNVEGISLSDVEKRKT